MSIEHWALSINIFFSEEIFNVQFSFQNQKTNSGIGLNALFLTSSYTSLHLSDLGMQRGLK